MSKNNKLELDSSSEEEEEPSTSKGFQINKSYAESYNRFREKEHFQKLKDKYGEDEAQQRLEEDLESSSSEEEDELGDELTEEIERDFFKTLACLKSNDPKIYDKNVEFFKKKDPSEMAKKISKKDKPMYLGDLERKVMLEKGGHFDDIEDEELLKKNQKSYAEELQEAKDNFKSLVDDDDEDDEFLVEKKKTKEEKLKQESDYKSWLDGKKEDVDDDETKKSLKSLRDYWNQDNLEEEEKYLKDYILNKRYLDQEDQDDDDRDYDKMAHDSDEDLSEDDANIKKQEEFEHKYNFRYEEPDADFIKRYPRTIEESMRKTNSKRKDKRQQVKERKDREKEARKQELQQLKSLKKKEILDKIEKIKKVSGAKDLEFDNLDLEDDFDPDKYDQQMAKVFNKYDQVEVENEEEKPGISDLESDLEDELETENWDDWGGNEGEEEYDEDMDVNDPNFVMDCDYEENLRKNNQQELIEASIKQKKRRKSKFTEAVEKKKPIFDPNDKTFAQYLDEYYKLDYEDIAGGNKCRFKYRDVTKNDFGLSTSEVLSAPDRELNAWCSLKKTCQYRNQDDETADLRLFKSRGNNPDLKKKLLPTLFEDNQDDKLEEEKSKKSKKNKKKRKRTDETAHNEPEDEIPVSKKIKNKEESTKTDDNSKKKKKKRNNKTKTSSTNKKEDVNAEVRMSDDRLLAYGLDPNKLKRKIRKQKYKQ